MSCSLVNVESRFYGFTDSDVLDAHSTRSLRRHSLYRHHLVLAGTPNPTTDTNQRKCWMPPHVLSVVYDKFDRVVRDSERVEYKLGVTMFRCRHGQGQKFTSGKLLTLTMKTTKQVTVNYLSPSFWRRDSTAYIRVPSGVTPRIRTIWACMAIRSFLFQVLHSGTLCWTIA